MIVEEEKKVEDGGMDEFDKIENVSIEESEVIMYDDSQIEGQPNPEFEESGEPA